MRSIGNAMRSGLTLVALALAVPAPTPGLAGGVDGKGIPFREEIALPCNTAKGICSKKLYAVPGDQQLEVASILCHFAAATDIVYGASLELDTTPRTYLGIPQQWFRVHGSIAFSDFLLKALFVAPPWRTLTLSVHYAGDNGSPRRAVADVRCSVRGSLVTPS
jgi:hypothetical protein